jgi:hypothetical protein
MPKDPEYLFNGLGFSLSADGGLAIGAAVLIVLIIGLASRFRWRSEIASRRARIAMPDFAQWSKKQCLKTCKLTGEPSTVNVKLFKRGDGVCLLCATFNMFPPMTFEGRPQSKSLQGYRAQNGVAVEFTDIRNDYVRARSAQHALQVAEFAKSIWGSRIRDPLLETSCRRAGDTIPGKRVLLDQKGGWRPLCFWTSRSN